MTALAQHLHQLGGLRAGADAERNRDVLWTSTRPQLYDLLVTRRGWSLTDYANHVLDMLAAALLTNLAGQAPLLPGSAELAYVEGDSRGNQPAHLDAPSPGRG